MTTGSEPVPWRGPLYLDASALIKLYLPEPESEQLEARLVGRSDLLVSDLSITDITSALGRRRREGAISNEVAARVHGTLLDDLAAGLYQAVSLAPPVHRRAEVLLLAPEVPALRASDALHLALALAAGAATVVSFDRRLNDAARALGLAPPS